MSDWTWPGSHAAHCCPIHGCKYAESDCPVSLGLTHSAYPLNNDCEQCAEEVQEAQREGNPYRAQATPEEPTLLARSRRHACDVGKS